MMKLVLIVPTVALCTTFLAGCGTPGKLRDIDLKGMYVNGYSETLAIGQGKITSIPGEREAMAAHYDEDVAWLSPNKKTRSLDLFLVGSNTVTKADKIIESICRAFADVAPTISSNDAVAATSGTTAFDLLQNARKSNADVALAKIAAAKTATPSTDPAPSTDPEPSPAPSTDPEPSPTPSPDPAPSAAPSTNPEPSPTPSTDPEPSPAPSTDPAATT